jgi:hypothetical protein
MQRRARAIPPDSLPHVTRLPILPRYGTADVSLLVPEVLAALGRSDERPLALPIPSDVRAVIVLIVDGLGQQLLDEHPALAPTLTAAPGMTIDAPFPTTTSTSITSIGTGVTPGQHGLIGTVVAVPEVDRPLVTLTWTWDRMDGGPDARDDVPPEAFQAVPPLFRRDARDGVRGVTVLRPEFIGSGLTRAALRGGIEVPAAGRDATLAAALSAATERHEPTVVWAHHGGLDAAGHEHGPGADPWCEELATTDAAIAKLAGRLPRDVALVVTADHGMVRVPPEGFVELTEHPELLDGVRVLAGDPRARHLPARSGAAADLLAAWRDHVGDRANVLSRDEAIAAGWYGPVVADHLASRIGDVVVNAARSDVAWIHEGSARVPGQHGAMTPEEIRVPALVLTN